MEEGKRGKRGKSVKGNSEPRSGSSVVARPVIRKFNRVAVVESFRKAGQPRRGPISVTGSAWEGQQRPVGVPSLMEDRRRKKENGNKGILNFECLMLNA
jgi:hypothetical protein